MANQIEKQLLALPPSLVLTIAARFTIVGTASCISFVICKLEIAAGELHMRIVWAPLGMLAGLDDLQVWLDVVANALHKSAIELSFAQTLHDAEAWIENTKHIKRLYQAIASGVLLTETWAHKYVSTGLGHILYVC